MNWLDDTDGPPGVREHTNFLYNPATARMESPRTFNQIRSGAFKAAAYGDLWIPAAGKRFRLMGFNFYLSSNATWVGGPFYIHLRDNVTVFDLLTYIDAGTSPPDALRESVELPGNGYLSLLADNKLRVYMSHTLIAGFLFMRCWGCEE